MTVQIPDVLIRALGNRRCFCLVKPRSKDPSVGGKGWKQPEKLIFADVLNQQNKLQRLGFIGCQEVEE